MSIRVTDWAMITPFGVGPDALLAGIRLARCAAAPIHRFDASGVGPAVACQVPPAFSGRDPKVTLAVAAAGQLTRVRADAWVHLAVGLECAHLEDWGSRVTTHQGVRTPLPRAAWALSKALGTHGPVTIDVSACAAGGLSLLTGLQILRDGLADQVVVGGVDAMVNPLGYAGMHRLGALSPSGHCRPFDRRRDGLLMGEGVALFVLERDGPALGTLHGGASTQDGHRVTQPRPDGSQAHAAVHQALKDAGVDTVDWICAHGTGTVLNDAAEIRALKGLDVPIRSFKGAFGHGMAAAGALEAAATWLCLRHSLLPGTVGFEQADADTDARHAACPRPFEADRVLSTNFGFGGQNVALVLGR